MSGLDQLLASRLVQLIRLAAVVIDRPQVAQRSVQPLAVVPADDLLESLLGLLSVGEFGFLQCFSQGAVAALHQTILFGAMRPDPLMRQPILGQHLVELARNVAAAVVTAYLG